MTGYANGLRDWFLGRSLRERILLGIMAALVAGIALVYGIALPLDRALDDARDRLELSAEREGRVRAKTLALSGGGADVVVATGALDRIVSDGAGEAGFAVGALDPQSDGSVLLRVESATPTALFSWLAQLERQGIVAGDMSVTPTGPGTVSATVALRRVAA